jgi:hypothetical protein
MRAKSAIPREEKKFRKSKCIINLIMLDADGDMIMAEDLQEETKEPVESPGVSKLFTPKPFTNHKASKLGTLTSYVEVTIYELYQKVLNDEKHGNRKKGEDETCRICLCELYENLESTPIEKIQHVHS